MYVAIAVILYLGFAILVGRFCSLSTKWEEAIAAIPEGRGPTSLEESGTELVEDAGTRERVTVPKSGMEETQREEMTVGSGV